MGVKSPIDHAIKKKQGKKEEEVINKVSFLYMGNDHIAEQVYDPAKQKAQYCVWKDGKISYEDELMHNSMKHRPILDEEVLKGAIHLPTKAEEYESDEKLDIELKEFINKWLDIPENILQFAIWNIKRSWIYDRFHTLNYLRALGDTGMGKSRFLDVLGSIHYKSMPTSGATTSAPVFRIIDKWKGTLIMDEADFRKSDEAQDIIKIINQGYEKGKFVMRCDQNDAKKINFFDPYCPKILATRKTFYDKAVESRCITHVMGGTYRKDIPPNLTNTFFKEAKILRNKLLMWRLRNFHKIDPEKPIDFDTTNLEPRVIQIVTSFINLFSNDKTQMKIFGKFIRKYQEELIDERQSSFYGEVVGAIHRLIGTWQTRINAHDIIVEADLTDQKGKQLKPRSLSSTLKTLGFEKSKVERIDEKTTKRCIPLDAVHLENLFKRYGFSITFISDGNPDCPVTQQGYTVTVVTILRGTGDKKINVDKTKPISNLVGFTEKVTSLQLRSNNRNIVTDSTPKVSSEIKVKTEEILDEKTFKNPNGEEFRIVDPTIHKCHICAAKNSKGWTLESLKNGSIYCDICAGRI